MGWHRGRLQTLVGETPWLGWMLKVLCPFLCFYHPQGCSRPLPFRKLPPWSTGCQWVPPLGGCLLQKRTREQCFTLTQHLVHGRRTGPKPLLERENLCRWSPSQDRGFFHKRPTKYCVYCMAIKSLGKANCHLWFVLDPNTSSPALGIFLSTHSTDGH